MDLYLVSDGLSHLRFVSANAVLHYLATTRATLPCRSPPTRNGSAYRANEEPFQSTQCTHGMSTILQRPVSIIYPSKGLPHAEIGETLAEISWGSGKNLKSGGTTWIRIPLSEPSLTGGIEQRLARELLYKKKGTFGSSRYFIGDDGLEYEWRKSQSHELQLVKGSVEVARTVFLASSEGIFANRLHHALRIQPECTIDIDMIVLTFLLMSRKRLLRQQASADVRIVEDGEDSAGDDGDSGAEIDGDGFEGEVDAMVGEV